MTALQDLLAKVEAGWPPDIDTPYMPPFREIWPDWRAQSACLANEGSLDAAKALHDAVLPGWDLQICTYEDDLFEVSVSLPLCVKTYDGLSEIIARAWLIAILRALIAQEEGA